MKICEANVEKDKSENYKMKKSRERKHTVYQRLKEIKNCQLKIKILSSRYNKE